jgi:hypothetical protein
MDLQASLGVYRELADWYERQGQPAMRDRFLVLAADAALSAGQADEAERLRQRLLQGSPHHMLKPYSSFAQALQSSTVQIYVHDLRENYPLETAENLLRTLRMSGEPTVGPTAGPAATPTAPFFSFDDNDEDEQTLPLDMPLESLKVYPVREEEPRTEPPASRPARPSPASPPTPAPRPSAASRPRTPVPVPPPPPKPAARAPAARAQALPPTRPVAPVASPLRPARLDLAPPSSVPDPAPAGAWLTFLLFGMCLTAGFALAVYTLARPFLPPHWLP